MIIACRSVHMVRLALWGHPVRELTTPHGVLHLGTDCSFLDEMTVLAAALPSAQLNGGMVYLLPRF